jgi:hypothetical protein
MSHVLVLWVRIVWQKRGFLRVVIVIFIILVGPQVLLAIKVCRTLVFIGASVLLCLSFSIWRIGAGVLTKLCLWMISPISDEEYS